MTFHDSEMLRNLERQPGRGVVTLFNGTSFLHGIIWGSWYWSHLDLASAVWCSIGIVGAQIAIPLLVAFAPIAGRWFRG